MTKLREQMIQEMTLRGLSHNTQRAYFRVVSQLAVHYGRSPSQISNREVKAVLFHLHQNKKVATSTCIVAAVALRFFYHKVLGRSRADFDVPIARKPRKLSPGTGLDGSSDANRQEHHHRIVVRLEAGTEEDVGDEKEEEVDDECGRQGAFVYARIVNSSSVYSTTGK